MGVGLALVVAEVYFEHIWGQGVQPGYRLVQLRGDAGADLL